MQIEDIKGIIQGTTSTPEHSIRRRRRVTSSSSSKPAKVGIHTLGGEDGKINKKTIPSSQSSNSSVNSNRQGRAYTKRGAKGGRVAFTGEDDIAGQLLDAVSSRQGAKGNSGHFFRFYIIHHPKDTTYPIDYCTHHLQMDYYSASSHSHNHSISHSISCCHNGIA